MTFRFANVEGRSALVDSDGRWFDASKVSGGVVHHDPMEAWLQLDELHLRGQRHWHEVAGRACERRRSPTTDSHAPERVRHRTELSISR